jgi:hypothetical protein
VAAAGFSNGVNLEEGRSPKKVKGLNNIPWNSVWNPRIQNLLNKLSIFWYIYPVVALNSALRNHQNSGNRLLGCPVNSSGSSCNNRDKPTSELWICSERLKIIPVKKHGIQLPGKILQPEIPFRFLADTI